VRFPSSLAHSERSESRGYQVRDLLDDTVYTWRNEWNYVRFDPEVRQGHILKLAATRELA
jgi:hypothetical protein